MAYINIYITYSYFRFTSLVETIILHFSIPWTKFWQQAVWYS